jgi:hypothetical protein
MPELMRREAGQLWRAARRSKRCPIRGRVVFFHENQTLARFLVNVEHTVLYIDILRLAWSLLIAYQAHFELVIAGHDRSLFVLDRDKKLMTLYIIMCSQEMSTHAEY